MLTLISLPGCFDADLTVSFIISQSRLRTLNSRVKSFHFFFKSFHFFELILFLETDTGFLSSENKTSAFGDMMIALNTYKMHLESLALAKFLYLGPHFLKRHPGSLAPFRDINK